MLRLCSSKHKISQSRRALQVRPSLETLEDRVVPTTLIALTAGQRLLIFDSAAPEQILHSPRVTGLDRAGERLVSIDARPANGVVYGLSNHNKLYSVDPSSGTASRIGIGAVAFPLTGQHISIDFNPVEDYLRVVSNADLNFRIDPNSGDILDGDEATPGIQPDTALAYAPGDVAEGANPAVAAIAHSSNYLGTTFTALYALDTNLNRLVRVGGPNGARIRAGREVAHERLRPGLARRHAAGARLRPGPRPRVGCPEGALPHLVRHQDRLQAGGPERLADLVAVLDEDNETPPSEPWLLLHELQSAHDPEKLNSTLIAAALFRARARDPDHAERVFRVLPVLIYLQGECPTRSLNMRTPNGLGIAHDPVVWEIAKDSAAQTLQEVEAGKRSWGALFWTSLMAEGGTPDVLALWLRLLDTVVPPERRNDVAYIALQFAELAGCRIPWQELLKGRNVTESILYKQAGQHGKAIGEQETIRAALLRTVKARFAGAVPEAYLELMRTQESYAVLDTWFQAALDSASVEDFLAVMRR